MECRSWFEIWVISQVYGHIKGSSVLIPWVKFLFDDHWGRLYTQHSNCVKPFYFSKAFYKPLFIGSPNSRVKLRSRGQQELQTLNEHPNHLLRLKRSVGPTCQELDFPGAFAHLFLFQAWSFPFYLFHLLLFCLILDIAVHFLLPPRICLLNRLVASNRCSPLKYLFFLLAVTYDVCLP